MIFSLSILTSCSSDAEVSYGSTPAVNEADVSPPEYLASPLSDYSEEIDEDYTAEPLLDVDSLEDVVSNPNNFIGNHARVITLTGHVTNIGSRAFYIQNESGTAELMIDFRGSQAFPSEGDEIIITGLLIQNCCDPSLFMLNSMSFRYKD